MKPEKKAVIKNHEVTIDRDLGEALVKVSVRSRFRNENTTKITTKDILPLAIEGGAEVIETLVGPTLTNRNGAATAVWKFKIPAIDPEHSTAAVLKRRAKKKSQEETVEKTTEDTSSDK